MRNIDEIVLGIPEVKRQLEQTWLIGSSSSECNLKDITARQT
jgi:hypothetical protein